MSIRLKLMLFISFLFLITISNSIFTFKMEAYEEEKLNWVIHTHEVLFTAEKLLSSLKDTETGQRGFLLTLNQSYLVPYYSGISLTNVHFRNLKNLTSDNQHQQDRLRLIEQLIKLKLDELASTVVLATTDINKALSIVKEDKGKHYMDDIRALFSEFSHAEMLLLEQRKGTFRAHRSQLVTFIIAEIIFFILLAFLTVPFLNRNFFNPLKLLVASTHRMEAGEKIDITDIVTQDEMGYLLARFYKMNEVIHSRSQDLNYKAQHDHLTGLKNRSTLFSDIDKNIQLKQSSNLKCGVCFLDVNKFKQLNDTFGHDTGDSVLIETADRIQNSIRSDDHIYRIGGDEFVVLIQAVNSQEEVNHIVKNILTSFDNPMQIQKHTIDISISIGIAIVPDNTTNSEEALSYSDIAMYAAKNDPQTHCKFFDKSMLKRASDS